MFCLKSSCIEEKLEETNVTNNKLYIRTYWFQQLHFFALAVIQWSYAIYQISSTSFRYSLWYYVNNIWHCKSLDSSDLFIPLLALSGPLLHKTILFCVRYVLFTDFRYYLQFFRSDVIYMAVLSLLRLALFYFETPHLTQYN